MIFLSEGLLTINFNLLYCIEKSHWSRNGLFSISDFWYRLRITAHFCCCRLSRVQIKGSSISPHNDNNSLLFLWQQMRVSRLLVSEERYVQWEQIAVFMGCAVPSGEGSGFFSISRVRLIRQVVFLWKPQVLLNYRSSSDLKHTSVEIYWCVTCVESLNFSLRR